LQIDEVSELEKCKISRANLARFVHLPFFNDLAIGCYVRVGIGQNNGISVYRVSFKSFCMFIYSNIQIAEIMDVVETAKVYTVEKTRTNKGLKLKHGADQKVYRLEFISNQPFENREWLQWMKAMRDKVTLSPINSKYSRV
jgi:RNA polymerase-associated protein RTF1